MFTQHRELAVVVCVALAMLAFTAGRAGSSGSSQDVTDAQTTQISWSYALNPLLRTKGLEVSVRNGTATLTGKVGDGASKALAEQIALGVSGVDRVRNRIDVQPDFGESAAAAISYGDVVYGGREPTAYVSGSQPDDPLWADRWITMKVRSTLLYARTMHSRGIAIATRRGVVTLSGTLGSGAERALAIQLASNVRGVSSVRYGGLTLLQAEAEVPAVPLVAAAAGVAAKCPPRWVCADSAPQRRQAKTLP